MLKSRSPVAGGDGLTVRAIARRVRVPLVGAYALLLVEQVVAAVQPWVLGLAINGVIDGRLGTLWLVAATSLAYMLAGTLRRAYDTRVYARLSAELTRESVEKLTRSGTERSAVIVRSDLVDEFVDFFERYLPAAVHTGASALGGVVALAVIEPRLAVGCLAAAAPVAAAQVWYARRSYALSGLLHDAMERRVIVLGRERLTGLRGVLERLRRVRIALSDAEAACFSVIELVSLALVLWAVVVLAGDESATAGGVFAGLAYVTMALSAFETAPYILQQASKLREIGTRV